MKMITISLSSRKTKILVTLSGGVLLGCVILILLNLSTSLSKEDAQKRVSLLLSKEITQRYVATMKKQDTDGFDIETATQLKEELDQINNLKFVSIDIKRLIPDILLAPHRPTHIVRIVLQNQNQQSHPRYFWLAWANVDKETSKLLWLFSI
jgi:hypothetical protein